jgi:hypothetical protein
VGRACRSLLLSLLEITICCISRLLVSQGAPNKHTALGIAAREGHIDIVKMLVKAGVDPNHQDSQVFLLVFLPVCVCCIGLSTVKRTCAVSLLKFEL